jgi:2-oxoglutarate ferredoxin oxidoreductase subunit delta
MAKVEFNEALCKGCGLCVSACPKKIIRLSERANEKGYFVAEIGNRDLCIGCGACFYLCPDVVITVSD